MPDTGIEFGLLIRAGSAKRVADSETATYKLDVTNGVTHRTASLGFYKYSPDNITHYQAEFRYDAFEQALMSDSRYVQSTLRSGRLGEHSFRGLDTKAADVYVEEEPGPGRPAAYL
jgi:hypothetical protein